MKKRVSIFVVAAAGAWAFAMPAPVNAAAEAISFTGGGVVGDRAIFLRMTSVAVPGARAEIGLAFESCDVADCKPSLTVGTLECAEFVPTLHGLVAAGGTLYASAIIDDNRRLIRAVDRGPGGGMDEVGIIIVDAVPDPTTSPCGAGAVQTHPLIGDFVSVQACTGEDHVNERTSM